MTAMAYEAAEKLLEERLSDSGFAHSKAVADTAVLLATIYGVDAQKARLAGLLHDWDREVPKSELVDTALKAGLSVTDVDRQVPYLLHARTGAAHLSLAMPDLPCEVVQAVERHTVGSSDMSDLDKVVYIADMLAPGRHYEGVEELRSLAGSVSLGDLFAQCYAQSLSHLVRQRKKIHPETVSVWNSLVARERR